MSLGQGTRLSSRLSYHLSARPRLYLSFTFNIRELGHRWYLMLPLSHAVYRMLKQMIEMKSTVTNVSPVFPSLLATGHICVNKSKAKQANTGHLIA